MELTRPLLVFDGDCFFCTRCARLLGRIGPRAEIVAWQHADLDRLPITEQQASEAVQWVGVDGTVRSGHEAIAAVLASAGPLWRLAGRAMLLPGVSWLAARTYCLIAANRSRISRVFRKLSGTT